MPPTSSSSASFSIAQVLSATALLAGLSPDEIRTLESRASRRRFEPGQLLFQEGEACHGLHIVAQGHVRIYKTSASGREQVLAVNGPGETVAELPVFDGGAYPASGVALDEVRIAFIAQRDLRAYCIEHPEVALKLLAQVGSRLRRLVGIIEELSFTTIRQRLVAVLIKLAENNGVRTAAGIEFQLPASHQELASQLGTVRELISRNLTRLQAEGLLNVDSRQIVVKDLKGLAAILDAGN